MLQCIQADGTGVIVEKTAFATNAGERPLRIYSFVTLMPEGWQHPESRRSTRVPLKITITVKGEAEAFTCEGETVVVNLHGALIKTARELLAGQRIELHVYLTGKSAGARVVHMSNEDRLHSGIELDHPMNIWGVSLPPEDWDEASVEHTR